MKTGTDLRWSTAVLLGMFLWGILASGACLFLLSTLGKRWVVGVEGITRQTSLHTSGLIIEKNPAALTVTQPTSDDPCILVKNTRLALQAVAKEN